MSEYLISGIWYFGIAGFALGLIIGSFLNVLIARYSTDRSALAGRSHCPYCQEQLLWWELIPVVSFVSLGGRCRSCRQPIAWQYPVVEVLSGLGTTAIFLAYGWSVETVIFCLLWWIGLVIFWVDLRQMVIPDRAVFSFFVVSVFYHFLDLPAVSGFEKGLVGSLIGGGIIGFIILATRGRGMGWGDAKLAVALGMLLGWPLISIGLFSAVILGAVVGMLLLFFKRRGWREPIPFGPFLLLGGLLAMLWGERLIEWYLRGFF